MQSYYKKGSYEMDGIKTKKKVYRIEGTEVQMLNTFIQTSN